MSDPVCLYLGDDIFAQIYDDGTVVLTCGTHAPEQAEATITLSQSGMRQLVSYITLFERAKQLPEGGTYGGA